MDNDALYLCMDQGGHSSRALVIDGAGQCLSMSQVPVAIHHPATYRVEQCPLEIEASLRSAGEGAIHKLSLAECDRIRAAGLVTQRSNMLCWNSAMEPLSPVLSWQDRRGAEWLEAQSLDPAPVESITGVHPSPYLGASKYRWCLDHLESVKEAALADDLGMGPMAAWLVARLGGRAPAVDHANASRTMLWSLDGEWSEVLLDRFGVPRKALPKLETTLADYGSISLAGREFPLRLVNGDQNSAAIGMGELPAQMVAVNLGSGGFLLSHCDQLPESRYGLQGGIAYWLDEPHWLLEGTVHGCAAALDWWAEQESLQYRPLLASALEERTPALFINTVGGLGSPDWRGGLLPSYRQDGNPLRRLAGVLESILFLVMRNLERIKRLNRKVARLRVSGGLARVDPLCQRLANLSQMPVERWPETEASALGAAWLLADRPSCWAEPEKSKRQLWLPDADEALAKRYQSWSEWLEGALE